MVDTSYEETPQLRVPESMKTVLYWKFVRFCAATPEAWHFFKKYALRLAKERKRYSARMIVWVIRYHTAIGDDPARHGFSIANARSPYFSRLFDQEFPNYCGLFKRLPIGGETYKEIDRYYAKAILNGYIKGKAAKRKLAQIEKRKRT